ncbi:hypothetical protein MTO96_015075 [Rhipicephalus appendiculatus]
MVVTSTHADLPRSIGGSNPPAPASSEMRFSCRSIRIGSYKVAQGEYWVTVSNRGFTFTVRSPRDGQEVTLQLLESDVMQVLGNLSRNMAVLFVSTNRDCAATVRTKLGMNRKQGTYFDPTSTAAAVSTCEIFCLPALVCEEVFPSSWLQVLRFVMSRNRKPLTLGEKLRIIEEAEKRKGATKASTARDLNIPVSSLKTILTKKDSILLNASKFGLDRKAAKDGKYAAMEKALVEWLRQARSSGIAMDGAILKEKAEIIALRCGIDDFKASNGCAWDAVTAEAIANSFRHCGFTRSGACSASEAAVPVDDEPESPEFSSLELPGSFTDYVAADADVAVCSAVSLDDIIETVRPDSAETSDEEEMDDAAETSAPIPTYAEKRNRSGSPSCLSHRSRKSRSPFLRQVFPGPLLHEIKQFQANEILIKSSPGPALLPHPTFGSCASQRASEVVVTSAATSTAQPQASSAPTVTHVVIHSVPSSTTILTRTTRSSSASSSAVAAVSSSSSVMATCEQGSSQEESSSGPNIKLLVYPAPPKTGGIPVHSADLRCLREGQFLNDVIIDFYLKYLLLERLSEEVRQRTHIFSSFFYPRLTQRLNPRAPGQQGLTPAARRHRNVRTWTRHVDIFAKDFIVVPINQNAHWFLAVLCFPGLVAHVCPPQEVVPNYDDHTPLADNQSPAASPKTPEGTIDDGESVLESDPDDGTELEETGSPLPKGATEAQTERAYILILDSLRGGLCGRSRIMTTLREYLTEEWKAKKRTQLSFCSSNMHGYTPRTPQQGNYSDCGIYLLQYVESFLEKPPSAGDPVKLELGDWFPEGRVAQKRAAIRDLILDLHLQQNPGSDFPQRWRKEEEEEEAAALRVEEPVSTTLLVTPATNTVILVCPGNSSSQPS